MTSRSVIIASCLGVSSAVLMTGTSPLSDVIFMTTELVTSVSLDRLPEVVLLRIFGHARSPFVLSQVSRLCQKIVSGNRYWKYEISFLIQIGSILELWE